MMPADTSPTAGPVIPAWVAPEGLRLRRTREQQQGPFWVLAAAMSITLIPCPLLVVAALLRHELACIHWIMLGFIPGGLAVLLLLAGQAWHSRRNRVSPVPDETVLVLLDRLREYTRARRQEVAFGRQTEAWLTRDGCYLGVGEYHCWEAYASFHLETLEPLAYRVALRRRRPHGQRILIPVFLGVLFTLVALGPAIDLTAAIVVYVRAGLRWDVAAAAVAAGALLISFACLSVAYRREPGRPGGRLDELLLLVDGERLSRADLVSLLRRYLPERV